MLLGITTLRRAGLLAMAVVASGCLGGVQGEVRPTVSPIATPSPIGASSTPTLSPSPTIKSVAFPDDLPLIIGTPSGDLFFQLKAGQLSGRRVHVCSSAVRDIATSGRRAAFACGTGNRDDPTTLYVYDDATGKLTTIARTEMSWGGLAFTPPNGLVYLMPGRTEPLAPIGMGKLMLRDLRTGIDTVLDERYGVAFGAWATPDGVAVWRPQNSLAFGRAPAEAGTWMLKDKTLTRLSLHRLIDGSAGHYLLESEPVDANGYLASQGTGRTYVVLRTDGSETRLTPSDVPIEQGVALLADGRVVAWRPSVNDPNVGTMVVYKDGVVVRQDPGRFGNFSLLRTGDWVIGTEITGRLTFRAYRISDGAFASLDGGDIRTIGILGPS
jgi:hypothetical protein